MEEHALILDSSGALASFNVIDHRVHLRCASSDCLDSQARCGVGKLALTVTSIER
jgi:hypothetical protein